MYSTIFAQPFVECGFVIGQRFIGHKEFRKVENVTRDFDPIARRRHNLS